MKEIDLNLPDSTLLYYPNFYSAEKADELFNELLDGINWKEEQIKVFGKLHWQPRLTAFYANNTNTYSYSSLKMEPNPFFLTLKKSKKMLKKLPVLASPLALPTYIVTEKIAMAGTPMMKKN